MRIWLDDHLNDSDTPNRHTPQGFLGAKTAEEFKTLIIDASNSGEVIDEIDFDNDLGEGQEEGYKLLLWLKDNYPEYVVGGTELKVHSANSVRAQYMREQIQYYKEHSAEILAEKNLPNPWNELKNI